MATNDITISVGLEDNRFTDGLVQVQKSTTDAVNSIKTSMKAATDEVDKHSSATSRLTSIIKEERQEHRMRAFAIREGAGAVGELSNIMVGPSGLTQGIQQAGSSFFAFDFALKGIGGTIGSLAVPISIALGAFALLKSDVAKQNQAYEDQVARIKKLKEDLGILAKDPMEEVHQKNLQLLKDAKPGWMEMFFPGIHQLEVSLFGLKTTTERYSLAITEAVLNARKAMSVADEETAASTGKLIKAEQDLLNARIRADIQRGDLTGLENAKAQLKIYQETLTNLRDQKAEYLAMHGLEFFKPEVQAQMVEYDAQILDVQTQIREQSDLIKHATGDISLLTDQWGKSLYTVGTNIKKVYTDVGRDISVARHEIEQLVRETGEQGQEEFRRMQDLVMGTVNAVATGIQDGLTAAFSGAEGAGKTFLKSIANSFISAVEAIVIAAEAASLAKGILSFGATLLADLPEIALAFAALETARALVTKFHGGGEMYFDASPSREMPILIRGQETVRVTTPEQEAVRGSEMTGGGVNIHINGPLYVADRLAFKRLVEDGMRTAGIRDVRKYFVNQKLGVVLG